MIVPPPEPGRASASWFSAANDRLPVAGTAALRLAARRIGPVAAGPAVTPSRLARSAWSRRPQARRRTVTRHRRAAPPSRHALRLRTAVARRRNCRQTRCFHLRCGGRRADRPSCLAGPSVRAAITVAAARVLNGRKLNRMMLSLPGTRVATHLPVAVGRYRWQLGHLVSGSAGSLTPKEHAASRFLDTRIAGPIQSET